MAVAQIQKIDDQYWPAPSRKSCQLRRVVKYFKGIEDFKELQDSQSRLCNLFKSSFLSAQTYSSGQDEDNLFDADLSQHSSSSSQANRLHASVLTNNTLFETIPIDIDTECLLLLGLLFCRDRGRQKASIFYSLLRAGFKAPVPRASRRSGDSSADSHFE